MTSAFPLRKTLPPAVAGPTTAPKGAPASPGKVTISLAAFGDGAVPLPVTIAGVQVAAAPREFSTGSFGWHVAGKIPVEVVGLGTVTCQVNLVVTVVGSKGAPR